MNAPNTLATNPRGCLMSDSYNPETDGAQMSFAKDMS